MQLSLFLITFPAFIFNYALPAAIELDPQSSKTKAEELSGLDDHGHQMEDGIKEKRCKELPQFDFYDNILGSPIQSFPLDLKRRDLQGEFMKLKCDTCRTTSFCKLGTKCDKCDKVCNPVKINERSADPKDLVGLAPRINVENGLSENQERYYTVGSFGPGPKQTLLARLLNIPWNAKLDRLIVLAKNNAKTAQSLPPHPVIIDTAHVFTVNDGKPAELDVEVHNVKNDLDEPSKLTSKLNKELDAAIETKKKILQDSHLTPEEIDKIIEHAITQGNDPAVIIEENQNHHEDDNLALARDFSEEGVKKKKKKKGKGKKHEFEDDEETPIGMSNLENGNSFASDANVGNTLNANTNFENNSPMREFDESIPLVGKTQDNLESVNDDILESKFKKKKKGHGGYGYGMYRENENVEDIPTGDEIIGSHLEGNEEILESKFKKKKGGKGYGMYREHELMEDNDDDHQQIIGNTETQLSGNNGDILESKFKKKKGGKGYGMYRENEEMQDEDVNMEDISSNDKKELTGSSLREENEDEILESKFKKKKKGGKGYGKGYGMYRENEEMQDEQINADNISSDDNKQLVGSTLREENEDEILESKFKKKKKGGKGYGYYRENENFGQDNEDMPNFRSNYENAAYPKSPANPPVAFEVPKQQFHEANQQYQSAPAYANSPQYETYQQPQTHQANQDYNVISVPAKSLPKPVSDSHYAYPAPAQSVPQPAYSNYPQQPEPPAPVYQEPLKTQQPTYTQITANQKPQVNPSYTQPATYQQQQEPQANYQVPSINQPPPPPPSNPYPQSQMQPAYAPEPNQPSNQQQPSYGYPQSPMYNHQNYQDMVPIE
ncbi:PREDICTED: uncharacterized protein DDB_G0284459-like, partial [Nicrophorus vespilloides]|uniref:Uncharacterized protein DDB_G0284459-like n=1 Tax=Nicrophorus vespilloides TaxID=110193 RepID=A0ABM1M9W0_NICVS